MAALAAYPALMANTGVIPTGAPLTRLPSADLEVAVGNVAAWGGNPTLFAHFLTAGLSAGAVPDESVRQLAAVAGWRSGVLGLRDEALGLLGTLPPPVAAAALGFVPDDLGDFVRLQQLDPYWWPGRAAAWGQVLRAGGFAGLGGPWLSPPMRAGSAGATGRWVVSTGDRWWQLDADLFGTRLVELTEQPECGPDTDQSGIRICVSPDSYLVSLTVPAEWSPGGGR